MNFYLQRGAPRSNSVVWCTHCHLDRILTKIGKHFKKISSLMLKCDLFFFDFEQVCYPFRGKFEKINKKWCNKKTIGSVNTKRKVCVSRKDKFKVVLMGNHTNFGVYLTFGIQDYTDPYIIWNVSSCQHGIIFLLSEKCVHHKIEYVLYEPLIKQHFTYL